MTEENEQTGGDESQTTGNSESPASLSQPEDENDEREDDEREDNDGSIHPLSPSVASLPGGESSTPNVSQVKKKYP